MGSKIVLGHEFYCCICGQRGIPIPRRKGAEREAGHLKRLFCLNCNLETNHCECVPNTRYTREDFYTEFYNNNFDAEGNRVRPYSELRRMINNGEIEDAIIYTSGNARLGQEHLDQE